ncbi:5-(carboxyamino)imidazole ribonucleotide synthase [Pseudooceanicola sp. CBS1P-1]|uniref:N5-carboxyaminoimidazole ribonucleotide synthase n=1 Tax=Pseudooceanicola albus TaxID=2692189 RepID=A0A6L7G7U9_9RHOB|nr:MULTISPECIES: 5-(carboxyamino)imidazole ribonucleotide synthase [Pseudooceanicola]MBT9382925.1 5-(carboxyamino)imidazole ribonucleotide synthase [Pseudooceanicola endophyticus]MXN20151.1 5-(carboxyamino)imidazole ribonucleotide synthase [Pseudooceanicola albus]
MTDVLPLGSTIGILGGGQLGRMLSVAASRLGFRTHVFEPGANPPAADVAHALTTASYEDTEALKAFAASVDVVTYEFENIPTSALDVIEALKPIRPNREVLRISQDRLTEKDFLTGLGLTTAPYADVPDLAALEQALADLGAPAILKTRRFGYDGKGQVRITDATQAAQAFAEMKGAPAILEGFVDFTMEISVIAARGLDGSVACFDPGRNVHREGILRETTVPAGIPARLRTDAIILAGRILNALDYVGVMGVELFVTPQGLLVNEVAPRVHNSGHWTQNGCATDQFEQHIRAVTGWPLGDGSRHSDVVMQNLIGDDMDEVPTLAARPGTALHLYGKAESRPGRKMGHANHVKPQQA